ncbi:MAG TPA: stage II sporulation protein E, partial [Thermoflexia bacterium]|nr:stage II sporulation protein E [Thermoflexia bacterium]
GKARERIAEVRRVRDLPRKSDGATRLARALLTADKIHFIVGLAVNPAQAADATGTIPLRRLVVEELIQDLAARGKLVSVEYL